METGVMRRFLTAALVLGAALAPGIVPRPALAGCDLSQVVGYTLVFAKTVDGYIEDGKQVSGFSGCTLDRLLVFTDRTGVRCKVVDAQTARLPTGYLFAKDQNDMKLCVGDAIYEVARAN